MLSKSVKSHDNLKIFKHFGNIAAICTKHFGVENCNLLFSYLYHVLAKVTGCQMFRVNGALPPPTHTLKHKTSSKAEKSQNLMS